MAKIAAKGAIVKTGSSATPTTNLAGIKEVAINLGEREMINVTSHDSSSVKEHIPAPLRDSAQLDITVFYDPAAQTHEDVRAAYAAGTKWYFTLVLPDAGAAQWAMSGYITNFSVPTLNPETGALEATISYKADAVETFTQ